jgi:hypothetical protein
MTDDKPQLALMVSIKDEGQYWHVEAPFMTRVEEDSQPQLRGMSASLWRNESPEIYSGLTISCQNDESHARGGQGPYAWQTTFRDSTSINLSRAQEMVKVLGKIEREMASTAEMAGSPPDFTSYLLRVASIFKIRHFAQVTRYGARWQNSEVSWLTPDNVRTMIEKAEGEYIARHKPAEEIAHVG